MTRGKASLEEQEKFKNILKSDRAPNGARKRRLTLFAVTGNNRFVPIKLFFRFRARFCW